MIVLAHDPVVTDRNRHDHEIAKCTADKLAEIDLGAGQGLPRLEDLVNCALEARGSVMADIKVDGHEEKISEILAALPPSRKIVAGAGDEGRRRFKEIDPEIPLSLTVGRSGEEALLRRWNLIDTGAVTFEYPLLTQERIAELHHRGIQVFAWTVDQPEMMEELAERGVDGLISNRPDLLCEIFKNS